MEGRGLCSIVTVERAGVVRLAVVLLSQSRSRVAETFNSDLLHRNFFVTAASGVHGVRVLMTVCTNLQFVITVLFRLYFPLAR